MIPSQSKEQFLGQTVSSLPQLGSVHCSVSSVLRNHFRPLHCAASSLLCPFLPSDQYGEENGGEGSREEGRQGAGAAAEAHQG